MPESIWVFGYGSLVWRPDFPFIRQEAAFIHGWRRRFWQGSTDHRGVPEAPGRVVTLLPGNSDDFCWGSAYEISSDTAREVVAHLDFRERGGYARHDVAIHFLSLCDSTTLAEPAGDAGRSLKSDPVPGTVYIATEDNDNYLGPAPLPAIAAQIHRSHGPSGPNVEYLFQLADALRALGANDPHVYELDEQVRALGENARG